jgi:hypothetical protein
MTGRSGVSAQIDLRDLVRRTEAVEEVKERDAGDQRRGLSDGGEIVRLLHRARRQQREPRLPCGHDVGVIPEDRECMRRDGPGGDVNAKRRQFSRDLVEIRDHQEETLRRRERRRQRPGLQRAVTRAGGAPFGLELNDVGHGAPEVAPALHRPGVGELAHRRRRGDRVDGDHFVGPVRDGGDGLVAVHRHDVASALHDVIPPSGWRFDPR